MRVRALRPGEGADPRTLRVLAREGALFGHVARKIRPGDMEHFDHVFAMDKANLRDLGAMFPASRGKARLALDLSGLSGAEVPDPYYGDLSDFEAVYGMLESALEAFLDSFERNLDNPSQKLRPAR